MAPNSKGLPTDFAGLASTGRRQKRVEESVWGSVGQAPITTKDRRAILAELQL